MYFYQKENYVLMLKYKKLVSIFEDDPDDDRCADECTDGIDRECVAVSRELAHEVAKQEERWIAVPG